MASANAGERAHSAVGPRAARSAATVVPHEPAPTTATTPFDMDGAYGGVPNRGDPYTGPVTVGAAATWPAGSPAGGTARQVPAPFTGSGDRFTGSTGRAGAR